MTKSKYQSIPKIIEDVLHTPVPNIQSSTTRMPGIRKAQQDIGFPGTRVIDGCELPHGYWEQNMCPLEEQQMFLITELALQFSLLMGQCCRKLIIIYSFHLASRKLGQSRMSPERQDGSAGCHTCHADLLPLYHDDDGQSHRN
ncbi:hypothetical protein STEG23_008424, partial [Scotinomys teguina]